MRELKTPKTLSFAALVQSFFTEYLVMQRAVSPRTVACYRDALMLFLAFAQRQLGKTPTSLRLTDLEPTLILAFLDHLEHERHNAVRSRNLRLTALRAFLKFAARHDLSSLHVIERALSVPMKRFERPMLGYLTHEEMLAILGQPGTSWTSQRDHPTICCWLCSTTPVPVSQRSSACASPMSCSMAPPACTCTARDASSAPFPCARRWHARSGAGYAAMLRYARMPLYCLTEPDSP